MRVTVSIRRNKSVGKPVIVGIAGGSGSGKTYLAKALFAKLGRETCEVVYQDNFYFDQSSRFDYDGGSVNFDHPSSIDFECLADALRVLRSGAATKIPIYDFVSHSRKKETLSVEPRPIIIVDGILILHSEPVRELFHECVFVETPEDLRFRRRLERDVKERGRTEDGVKNQFVMQVKPMHDQFVEPSKTHADLIIRDTDDFHTQLEELCRRLRC
jgi:uridine kinase